MIRVEIKNCNMILTEKPQKYQHYHLENLINANILQVYKYYLLIKKRVIEQAKFAYSPLGKAFGKQTKTIEDQDKKKIKAVEDHGKQLVESNKLVKKDFNIDRHGAPLEK